MTREELARLHEYRINIPEGKSGDWYVKRYSYSEADITDKHRDYPYDKKYIPFTGITYTKLCVDPPLPMPAPPEALKLCPTATAQSPSVIMSDEPYEVASLIPFMEVAYGKVLITGLGLGVALSMLAPKEAVTHITVIENSSDVIKLTGTYWKACLGDRLRIVEMDAYLWDSDEEFDCAFHDMIDTMENKLVKLYKVNGITMSFESDAWRL